VYENRYVFDEIYAHKGAAVLNMFRVYMNTLVPGSFEVRRVRSDLEGENFED
jgi:hypothetical protein